MTVETTWNTTQSLSNSMDASGWFPLIFILGVIILALTISFALSSLERYKRIWAILTKMGTSVLYFAYGLCVIVPLVIGYFLLSWLFEYFTRDFTFDPIWIVYIIGGYAGISTLGWIVKRGIDRVKELHKEVENK